MQPSSSRSFSVRAIAAVLALSVGGCTLWVDAQLSDKPEGTGGSGGGQTTTSGVTTTTSGVTTTSEMMCPKGRANCDGVAHNGCETELTKDEDHCGACDHACKNGENCKDGSCD